MQNKKEKNKQDKLEDKLDKMDDPLSPFYKNKKKGIDGNILVGGKQKRLNDKMVH